MTSSGGALTINFNGGDLTLAADVALQSTGGALTLATTGSHAITAGKGGTIKSTDNAVTLPNKAMGIARHTGASTYTIHAKTALTLASAVSLTGTAPNPGATLLLIEAGTISLTGSVAAADATDEIQV